MADQDPATRSERDFHLTNCRFYEQKYPDLDDLVMVKVRTIQPTAAYCHLLEYNNCEGMIPLSEVSRRRIRSIGKHLRIGKTEAVQVFRVDKEKGYIDLSKKKVTADDIAQAEDRYNNAKAVHSIMSHVGMEWCKNPKCDVANLEQLYELVGWPLARKFGTAFDAFRIGNASPEKVFGAQGPLNIDPELQEIFVRDIRERLKAQPHRYRADIELTCFAYEGIDAVKEVLTMGLQMGTEQCPLKITLTACPQYVLRVSSLDRDEAKRILDEAIEKMGQLIKERGGRLKIEKPPWETTAADDHKVIDDDSDAESEDSDEDDDDDEGSPDRDREIMEPSKVVKRKK